MKPLVLAIAVALVLPSPLLAQAPAATSVAAQAKATPAWITASNANAMILVKAQADFTPENFSFFGVPGYDDKVADFGAQREQRFRAAVTKARAALAATLRTERNPDVRQDLEILLRAADQAVEGSALNEKLTLPWIDAPRTVFSGIQSLLSEQTPPARRAQALDRLKAYVGLAPGSTPITELAKARYVERATDKTLLRPTRLEVEQSFGNVDTFVDGIRKLFASYRVADADAALAAMDTQLHDYAAWARATVLPEARATTQLPPELYAFGLKRYGIDIAPQELVKHAELEFMETRAAMRQLAPLVARAKGLQGIDDGDYLAVIRALKKETIANDQLETRYRKVIDAIDPIIRQRGIVEVPQRPMVMRLGSAAESAAQPAPHFLPAPLVGNTGQQGQFVLPVAVPQSDGSTLQYDDFNFESAAWTLSAHEGRPGHELQFTAMVERGISLARTLFAFN
ncbi:MAG: DUF885 family protein, partial [Luteimonas sp.]